MVFVGMLLTVLEGFQWLIPVYFLKLLSGFTATDDVGFGPLDMADIAGEVHSRRANAANLS